MKPTFTLILLLTGFMGFSQKTNTKDTVTISNAYLISEVDRYDIEAMVTYYFASRIRKDDKWKAVVGDSSIWSPRMKSSIKKHNDWTFVKFKNMGLHTDNYGTTVKVYFRIRIANGKEDGGVDDVEIKKIGYRWLITKVPE